MPCLRDRVVALPAAHLEGEKTGRGEVWCGGWRRAYRSVLQLGERRIPSRYHTDGGGGVWRGMLRNIGRITHESSFSAQRTLLTR